MTDPATQPDTTRHNPTGTTRRWWPALDWALKPARVTPGPWTLTGYLEQRDMDDISLADLAAQGVRLIYQALPSDAISQARERIGTAAALDVVLPGDWRDHNGELFVCTGDTDRWLDNTYLVVVCDEKGNAGVFRAACGGVTVRGGQPDHMYVGRRVAACGEHPPDFDVGYDLALPADGGWNVLPLASVCVDEEHDVPHMQVVRAAFRWWHATDWFPADRGGALDEVARLLEKPPSLRVSEAWLAGPVLTGDVSVTSDTDELEAAQCALALYTRHIAGWRE